MTGKRRGLRPERKKQEKPRKGNGRGALKKKRYSTADGTTTTATVKGRRKMRARKGSGH